MDIVSRLKIFMTSLNITSTQFADACGIPRPSLSQLLNGRNKKVSDEILTKIHDSFPDLSIPWLLFGEGSMDISSNIQFSKPQNNDFRQSTAAVSIENQPFIQAKQPDENSTIFSSNNFTTAFSSSLDDISTDEPLKSTSTQPSSRSSAAIRLNTSANKRITNIVVFYDDNSFESFNPA